MITGIIAIRIIERKIDDVIVGVSWRYKTGMFLFCFIFFFQAEDGIRGLVRSRGLGDV